MWSNVTMWKQMWSIGQSGVVKLLKIFYIIIWCYHVVLSCYVIMWDDNTPFFIIPETTE